MENRSVATVAAVVIILLQFLIAMELVFVKLDTRRIRDDLAKVAVLAESGGKPSTGARP